MITSNIHCFWHQEDNYTITSKGFIWAYPNMPLINQGILVIRGRDIPKEFKGQGICTDFPMK